MSAGHAFKNNRFRSKLHALQQAVPVYACVKCRTKHSAPKHAQCTKCHKIQDAMVRINGKPFNKECRNCGMPNLKNKYMVPHCCTDCGHTEFDLFHSTGEYNLFVQLAMLQDNGKIKNLRRQVPYPIQIKGDKKPLTTLVVDFVFDEPQTNGGGMKRRVIDYKGDKAAVTDVFKLKKIFVERFYPGVEIEVITAR